MTLAQLAEQFNTPVLLSGAQVMEQFCVGVVLLPSPLAQMQSVGTRLVLLLPPVQLVTTLGLLPLAHTQLKPEAPPAQEQG